MTLPSRPHRQIWRVLATSLRSMDRLAREADQATEMLSGRTVRVVRRHRPSELLIEFDDGTRLFVNAQGALELSITGGADG